MEKTTKTNDEIVTKTNNEMVLDIPEVLDEVIDIADMAPTMSLDMLKSTARNDMICSFELTAHESKVLAYNAIQAPMYTLKENVNSVINMVNYVACPITVRDESGGLREAVRVVIIDDKGETYKAASIGVINSLAKIISTFGAPDTWTEPLKIIPKTQEIGANRNTTVLTIAM